MIEQRSPEWFKQRQGKITGSNVGAILGLHPSRKANDVMRDMVREYHGLPRLFQGNAATEWGTNMESGAIAEYEMEQGCVVQDVGFCPHPEHDWLGASPDGLIGDDCVFEVKCPFSKRNDEFPEFKQLADMPYYHAQVQIEMYCTGRSRAAFYQWAPRGTKLEWLEQSQQWLDRHIPKLKEFYDAYLIERELPNAERWLKDRHEKSSEPYLLNKVRQYKTIAENIKELEQAKKDLLADILDLSGGRELDCGVAKLTKVERKGSVNYKAVPELKGVDLEKYRKEPASYWTIK
jgi:putative phage-type endonuclease